MRKMVLFLPSNATSWSRMLPQIRALAASPDAEPHVVLAIEDAERPVSDCHAMGVAYTVMPAIPRHDREHLSGLGRWAQRERVMHGFAAGLLAMRRVRRRLITEKALFAELFRRLGGCVLMVQGDRELGPIPGALAAAGELGLARIIAAPGIPSIRAMSVLRRGQWRFRVDAKAFPPLLNLVAAARFPAQAQPTDFGRLLFSPGWLTLALASAGMLSANPWCLGNGNSDYVLLDSKTKKDEFVRLGVNDRKLLLIGSVDTDPLYREICNREALRDSMAVQYGFDLNQPIVVCSVPIYGEHDLMPMDRHLAEIERIFEVLGRSASNVVLSLHPKSNRETYAQLASRYGLQISNERLYSLLPAADIFVCGSSTTIEWAVMTGIPTLNVDYCGLNDDAIALLRGVVRVETAATLEAMLGRLTSDPEWYRQLAQAQNAAAEDMVPFDGQATARFVALIEGLLGRCPMAAASMAVGERR